MARLPRLAWSGLPHYVWVRGHDGRAIVRDDEDRQALLGTLREAAHAHEVSLHAYALLDDQLHLLATPARGASLGRMVQDLGRRYVARFNRRHGRSGALWDGRYRAAVVEPGAVLLGVLHAIDARARAEGGPQDEAHEQRRGSAAHRLGRCRDASLVDPPEYWQLGNTPFERQARWEQMLRQPAHDGIWQALRHAAAGGWAYGSAAFIADLAERAGRPLQPRPRGRPRKRQGLAGANGA